MDVKRAYQTVAQVRKLVRAERRSGSSFDPSLRQRCWCYRRGFLSKSHAIYDFEAHDPGAYLSDYQRFLGTKRINGHWNALIDNKLAFHRVLGEYPAHRPTVYGMLVDGRFHAFDPDGEAPGDEETDDGAPAEGVDGHGAVLNDGGVELEHPSPSSKPTADPLDWVDDHLSNRDRLVLKWFSGGGGNNVHFLERRDDEYYYDGSPTSEAELAETLASLENYLVCEFVEQADYANDLFPDAANTIRVLTMFDERNRGAFVPIAIHRLGTRESVPVDNFSNGGLSAEIDRETGRLGTAAAYPTGGSVDWHETHPDTGTRIEGTEVPGWPVVRDRLLEIAETLSHVPYVGWDVVVTGEGEFSIIEANSYPGVASLQVHRPLLAEERTRRFYRNHGVI
ncbi:sugar-transfer associated ATP-grasp domain-containing protein [Halosolutus amylolyticus]|uniref:Sugar-transfer associated ATP-grasp domain-containing protein n=1 Tax=Halosolutus amylolyticus TaxID=2932267 RepID=A0ABD5PP47_9EURY|nr:sugar-transfer associated ATP-grasp domain-containing protein [Halosolutus amylolyticus]